MQAAASAQSVDTIHHNWNPPSTDTSSYSSIKTYTHYLNLPNLMPNTHRRCRRDETVKLRRVGGVYMNSQLAHDDFRWIRRSERIHRPWPRLQFCSQWYRSRILRNMWHCMFVKHSNQLCSVIFVNFYNFFNKKLSYCWETVRRESMPRIAEMDVEMTT